MTGEFSAYCSLDSAKQNAQGTMDDKCLEFNELKDNLKWTNYLVTGFIFVVNYLSKELIRFVVRRTGRTTRSDHSLKIYYFLTAITTLQSIFIILLLNFQLDFVPLIGWYFSDGKNRDITSEFYEEMGSIFILRMVI